MSKDNPAHSSHHSERHTISHSNGHVHLSEQHLRAHAIDLLHGKGGHDGVVHVGRAHQGKSSGDSSRVHLDFTPIYSHDHVAVRGAQSAKLVDFTPPDFGRSAASIAGSHKDAGSAGGGGGSDANSRSNGALAVRTDANAGVPVRAALADTTGAPSDASKTASDAGKKGDGATGGGASAGDGLDAKKSVSDLIKSGVFKDKTDGVEGKDYKSLDDMKRQAPEITVAYENKDKNADPPPPRPNYIVRKDGTIEVVHDPEGKNPDGNIVIQVERDDKQVTAPSDQQQKAIDELVAYQAQRIVDKYGDKLTSVDTKDGQVKQVDVNDAQNLVSDSVEQKFGDKIPPQDLPTPPTTPQVPPDVGQTADGMNRVGGSGGGSMDIPRESQPGMPPGVDQLFPPRDVPQPPSEPDAVAATKDMAASLFNPGHDAPYDAIKFTPGIGAEVGRYGMNQGLSMMGLAQLLGIDLGDPPDFSKLEKYLQDHPDALKDALHKYADKLKQDADKNKLPADDKVRATADALDKFADKMGDKKNQADFVKFLGDMKDNPSSITKDRLNQFMPKELQEAVAEGGIDRLAKNLGVQDSSKIDAATAGKIGLGMFLGRTPTKEDLANPQYQQYLNAGENMFKLAEARLQSLGDIRVSDANGKVVAAANQDVGQKMWAQSPFAGITENGNLGCAASVSEVLKQAGFSYANNAGVSGLQDQLMAHGWTIDSTPRPGDVICAYRQPKGNSSGGGAHCGIVGVNGASFDNHSSTGQWSQDPMSVWNAGEYPAGVVFLRPPGA
jgi:hypothetical protein